MSAARKLPGVRQALDAAVAESELQAAVIELAQLRGWLVHHCRPGATARGRWATQIQGNAGFPDLVLARGTQVLFVELKREREDPTDSQKVWLGTLADVAFGYDNVGVAVWKPSDWSSGEIERRLA